jgi:hypothetical protein
MAPTSRGQWRGCRRGGRPGPQGAPLTCHAKPVAMGRTQRDRRGLAPDGRTSRERAGLSCRIAARGGRTGRWSLGLPRTSKLTTGRAARVARHFRGVLACPRRSARRRPAAARWRSGWPRATAVPVPRSRVDPARGYRRGVARPSRAAWRGGPPRRSAVGAMSSGSRAMGAAIVVTPAHIFASIAVTRSGLIGL